MVDAPDLPEARFQQLLRKALERNLLDAEVSAFLSKGDAAMFDDGLGLEAEDFTYLLDDVSRLFQLREPDSSKLLRFWKLNIFDRCPRYELTGFSVAQLRAMTRDRRWSVAVTKPIQRKPW